MMLNYKFLSVFICVFSSFTLFGQHTTQDKSTGKDKSQGQQHEMKVVTMDDMTWSAGPKTLPSGAQLMVLSGDPTKEGIFTIRLKFPAGYKVMPHWHGADENVTVLKGKLKFGMGDTFEEATMSENPVGTYINMAAGMRHYAMATEETIIQLHGMGPFNIYYVNPNDDPSRVSSR